jgi:hypothetical protein
VHRNSIEKRIQGAEAERRKEKLRRKEENKVSVNNYQLSSCQIQLLFYFPSDQSCPRRFSLFAISQFCTFQNPFYVHGEDHYFCVRKECLSIRRNFFSSVIGAGQEVMLAVSWRSC